MKLIAKLACASVIALAAAGGAAAPALAETFVGGFTTSAPNADPGLVVQTTPLASGLNFSLTSIGQSFGVDLFQIFTNEASLELDDYAHAPFGVNFTFTAPTAFNGSVNGETFGASFFGLFQHGSLVWDNGGDKLFDFGNGTQLTAHLDNASFNQGGIGDALNPGPANVHATFTLTAVPEPATWAMMILGMGMVGAGLRLRNRRVLAAT